MSLAKEKHVRYWRMCAQSLPHHYISNDSSRMTLGFFIVSALDLLDALNVIPEEEKQSWISWIYSCQVPEGGFRGFTGTDLRDSRSTYNKHWDPASVPATFFALATLIVLGDDLSQVKRLECLQWLPKLQRDDGSFGEVLSGNDTIAGDRDLRQCCCAAGIAYMLQAHKQEQPPFDIERLTRYIQLCQSQSGGFGVSPQREPHSGLSYCAVAALSFARRLLGKPAEKVAESIWNADQCIKWFIERQTSIINEDEDESEDEDANDNRDTSHRTEGLVPSEDQQMGANQLSTAPAAQIAGFNGRDGKVADTCYAFWNVGALAILEKESLVDIDAMRSYLLEITQHRIGGFGKGKGDPPDILHSYLGLAALALFNQPELKALDPTLCMSSDAAMRLHDIEWTRSP